jgi:molybdopterin synthase catalytic subunit
MEIVSNNRIDPSKVYEFIKKDNSGSVVFHFAVLKGINEGRTISSAEYYANGDVDGELRTLTNEIHGKWQVNDVLIIRRLGRIDIGEIISLVAVSSPNREKAFAACDYGVKRLKEMSSIKKKETFL